MMLLLFLSKPYTCFILCMGFHSDEEKEMSDEEKQCWAASLPPGSSTHWLVLMKTSALLCPCKVCQRPVMTALFISTTKLQSSFSQSGIIQHEQLQLFMILNSCSLCVPRIHTLAHLLPLWTFCLRLTW